MVELVRSRDVQEERRVEARGVARKRKKGAAAGSLKWRQAAGSGDGGCGG